MVRFVAACVAAFAVQVFSAPAGAQKAKEPWEYLQDPAFAAAYTKALGPMARTPWLAKRDGPAPQDKFITIGGERYVMNAFCKNRDCADNNAVILYSPTRQAVHGVVYEKGKHTTIGSPPAPVAAELPRLWKKEWRTQ